MKRYFLLGIVILITAGVLNNCGSSSIAPDNTDENDESDESDETGGPATATIYNDITDFSKWSAFDPSENGVGTRPEGYVGGVFDGRYIYFSPDNNGGGRHGEVLRFDTEGDFTSTDAWTTYDPHADGVGTYGKGFRGVVFDGRYVYFAPCQSSTSIHAEVLRYDTEAEFQSASSWSVFDMRANGIGPAKIGMFHGAVFDGKYVYFVPFKNSTSTYASIVARYDTEEPFTSASSWKAYDAEVGTTPRRFVGGVFDGRYIYFVPFADFNGSGAYSEVLRYDTEGDFETDSSWSAFDPGENGVGMDLTGLRGAVFDGAYIYFAPSLDGHGEVLQYNVSESFTSASSWSTFDPSANGVGVSPKGYWGGVFDGRYITFIPHYNGSKYHAEALKYDTEGSFTSPDSWSAYDPTENGLGIHAQGFAGGAFDGKYIYFIPGCYGPTYVVTNIHGEFLRFEAKTPASVPETVYGGSFF